ncbi:MAG: Mur ligase family protein [Lachnospiraceae bacterium]
MPLTVFRLREEDEIAVLEMGISDFGEMHRLASIARPDICVITNIGYCHLENLGDRDGVFRAKTEIFDHLKGQDTTVILNGDDDKLVRCGTGAGKSAGILRAGRKTSHPRLII